MKRKLPDNEEALLVLQLRENSIEAFNTLYAKYSPNLYRFAFSLLKNKTDSEEIVQEVFCRLWQTRYCLDPSRSFKSYLFKIAYHISIDILRERLKNRNFIRTLETKNSKLAKEESLSAEYNILQKQIEKIVEELPLKRKEIFKLSRYRGLSNKEIASGLGISVKTVENQITLSIKKIKMILGSEILP